MPTAWDSEGRGGGGKVASDHTAVDVRSAPKAPSTDVCASFSASYAAECAKAGTVPHRAALEWISWVRTLKDADFVPIREGDLTNIGATWIDDRRTRPRFMLLAKFMGEGLGNTKGLKARVHKARSLVLSGRHMPSGLMEERDIEALYHTCLASKPFVGGIGVCGSLLANRSLLRLFAKDHGTLRKAKLVDLMFRDTETGRRKEESVVIELEKEFCGAMEELMVKNEDTLEFVDMKGSAQLNSLLGTRSDPLRV